MMDYLQLVFGFVNAPLFATFLLGMFWKRATGHGAFWGLVTGTLARAATYFLTVAEHKGGFIANLHQFPSSMAQNFWVAISAFVTCFVVTVVVSLATKPRPASELVGLVYSETPHQAEEAQWYRRPATLALVAGRDLLCPEFHLLLRNCPCSTYASPRASFRVAGPVADGDRIAGAGLQGSATRHQPQSLFRPLFDCFRRSVSVAGPARVKTWRAPAALT